MVKYYDLGLRKIETGWEHIYLKVDGEALEIIYHLPKSTADRTDSKLEEISKEELNKILKRVSGTDIL